MIFMCPVAAVPVKGNECKVRTCMYHHQESGRNCGHARLHSALTQSDKKGVIEEFFNTDTDEVETAKERILNVLKLGRYFSYVFDKSLLDTKQKDLDLLAKDEARFESWVGKSGMTFDELVRTIHFVKTNLR